jgi:hypothetical protein
VNHLVVAACGLECPRNKWWLNHLLRLLDRLLSIECGTRVARDGSGAYAHAAVLRGSCEAEGVPAESYRDVEEQFARFIDGARTSLKPGSQSAPLFS